MNKVSERENIMCNTNTYGFPLIASVVNIKGFENS